MIIIEVASWLFAQPFARTQIKEIFKAPPHWPLWGESSGHPSQRASNTENVSIWWHRHVQFYCYTINDCYTINAKYCFLGQSFTSTYWFYPKVNKVNRILLLLTYFDLDYILLKWTLLPANEKNNIEIYRSASIDIKFEIGHHTDMLSNCFTLSDAPGNLVYGNGCI